MAKADLEEFELWYWGEDTKGGFWAFWRGLSDLHNGYPGTRKEGYDACKKLSMDELREMEAKTRELVKWDRLQKRKGVFVPQYKNLCRWISKGAYERYVGNYNEKKEQPKREIDLTEYNKKYLDAGLEYCIEMGIIEKGKTTRREMRERCMDFMANNGFCPSWIVRNLKNGR